MEESRLEITLAGRALATFRDERDLMDTAAARVSELDAMARRAASEAVRCALAAGAILLAVKGRLPHGAFLLWLSQNCGSVSERTAQKYMALAERTQAEAEALPADGDGPKALIGDRSLTDLYRDYGIVRREASASWGGAREGAGRPAANPDPAADAVKVWTLAAEGFRRITPTSYRFLPLREAEGLMVELDAVRDRLRARIAELKSSAEVAP